MTTTQQTTDGTAMQAIIQDHYGEAEDVLRLEQIARPAIGDEEVLLRVHAAGVDRGVWHLMTGLPYPVRLAGYGIRAPKTRVRGREVAGRVEATGPAVTALHVGVGTFAVQIAKAAGAEVTGVASTAKLDMVRSLGAGAHGAHRVRPGAARHRPDLPAEPGPRGHRVPAGRPRPGQGRRQPLTHRPRPGRPAFPRTVGPPDQMVSGHRRAAVRRARELDLS